MKQSRFTETQIVAAIKKQESGNTVKEISRELGISEATLLLVESQIRWYGSKRGEAHQRARSRIGYDELNGFRCGNDKVRASGKVDVKGCRQ